MGGLGRPAHGGKLDYDSSKLLPSKRARPGAGALRTRVADWVSVKPEELVHALVAEYSPGTPLGWHRGLPARFNRDGFPRRWRVAGVDGDAD